MKRIIVLMMSLLLMVMATGCAKNVHINDVTEDKQEVEKYIRDAGLILEAARGAQSDIFGTALIRYTDGDMSKDSFAKVVKAGRNVDMALTTAGKTLKEFTKESRAGKSPTRAGVEAAIIAVKDVLKQMEVIE